MGVAVAFPEVGDLDLVTKGDNDKGDTIFTQLPSLVDADHWRRHQRQHQTNVLLVGSEK